MKLVEKPKKVDAIQFKVDTKPWPEGVFEVKEEWMIADLKRYERHNIVAYIYAEPDPYINYLRDGDWIVTEKYTNKKYAISDEKLRQRFTLDI